MEVTETHPIEIEIAPQARVEATGYVGLPQFAAQLGALPLEAGRIQLISAADKSKKDKPDWPDDAPTKSGEAPPGGDNPSTDRRVDKDKKPRRT